MGIVLQEAVIRATELCLPDAKYAISEEDPMTIKIVHGDNKTIEAGRVHPGAFYGRIAKTGSSFPRDANRRVYLCVGHMYETNWRAVMFDPDNEQMGLVPGGTPIRDYEPLDMELVVRKKTP